MIIEAVATEWKSFSVSSSDTKTVQNRGVESVLLLKATSMPDADLNDGFLLKQNDNAVVSGEATFYIRSTMNTSSVFVEN